MSLHSFIKETVEPGLPTATPEPSRRYVQWKEDDVGLLLTDLEQPGHYAKWKENKSGFSKRVAEQVFKNVMYHEAIKFKVRWLESRFKLWNQQLTTPELKQDELSIVNIREKMFKEFPYYDRCRPIFTALTVVDSPVQANIAPAVIEHIESDMKPELIHMTNEPSSPTLRITRNPFADINNKRMVQNSTFAVIKKRKSNPFLKPSPDSSCIYRNTDGITEDKVKVMELELELKKMDHQERMQEMKLEQLRLEIELQKLKRDTPISLASTSD